MLDGVPEFYATCAMCVDQCYAEELLSAFLCYFNVRISVIIKVNCPRCVISLV